MSDMDKRYCVIKVSDGSKVIYLKQEDLEVIDKKAQQAAGGTNRCSQGVGKTQLIAYTLMFTTSRQKELIVMAHSQHYL